MERIRQSLYKTYLPIRLFLDDLHEIAHILGGAKKFSISTGNLKCSSVEENLVTLLSGAIFGVLVGPYIREFLQMLVK